MSIAEKIFTNAIENPENAKLALEQLTPEHDISFKIIYEFYLYLKSKMNSFCVPRGTIFDVCGTGGSGLCRVNISTILAIKLVKSGFIIAKHSNRASSGKVGSIDIVEKMNLEISNTPEEAKNSIIKNNYSFLFAPGFHPELKIISNIRKQIAKPTIINFVMPLLNPVINLSGQITGVSSYNIMKLMVQIAHKEKKNILLVHDTISNLDDVSILGETIAIEVVDGKINEYIIKPEDFKMKREESFQNISGFENPDQNMLLATQILNSSAPKSYLNFLLINEIIAKNFFAKIS